MQKIQVLLKSDATGGVLLIIAAILAMIMANSDATQSLYQSFLAMPIVLQLGSFNITKDALHWINEAFMASFFLYVGLEVKKELIQGSLSNMRQAALPIFAALGGIFIPVIIFLAFSHNQSGIKDGWAISIATDIAFALGVLALLGKRVPVALKMFLMALAIIDDLGAIIIIAIFYTNDLSVLSLTVASCSIALLILLNRLGVRRLDVYLVVGTVLWSAVLKSGVHATLAGAVIGLCIPLEVKNGLSPAKTLERTLQPWVTFAILPLFAFGNAGVALGAISWNEFMDYSALPLGIFLGLFVGKPLGITLFCWAAIKLKLASLPSGVNFKQVAATGVLCGIGFTMSIFIATLAFDSQHLIEISKIGILGASLISATVGYLLLRSQNYSNNQG